MKKIHLMFVVLGSGLMLAACGQSSVTTSPAASAATETVLSAQAAGGQSAHHRHYKHVNCALANGERGRCHAEVVVADGTVTPMVTSTPAGYSPAQMRHAYGFDQIANQGAGQTIAIVDAYDAPTIANDLNVFKSQYGISGCNLTKVSQTGSTSSLPATDAGWAQEISLDVEWACAIAPKANILLVEVKTPSMTNLMAGVDYAAKHAQVVSMSFGGDDSSSTSYDSHFNVPGVAFVASSGDDGNGASYPATSPYVLAVGGTNLPLDASGNRSGAETTWSGSGGGISSSETEPGYQKSYGITSTGGKRGSPDVAYNADPQTGVAVYDSTDSDGSSGWMVFGGTSAGAPQWAALVAQINAGRSKTIGTASSTTSPFYSAATGSNYAANYLDITSGTNGSCGSVCTAKSGYDLTTGVGSPKAAALIPYLQSH